MDHQDTDPVPAYISGDATVPDDGSVYRPDVTAAFFAAIESNDVDAITLLLDTNPGLCHVPYTQSHHLLPLYAATVAGNPYVVALIAQRGAPIDELSPTGEFYDDGHYPKRRQVPVMRTPLMAAASQGSLPLVKLLFHDLKADDSIVAPDGATALRLAVLGKHSGIAALLPSRRTGGWLRFKHSNRKAWRRIRKAGHSLYVFGRFFVWEIPKFFVWSVPKFLLWELPKSLLPSIRRGLLRAIKAIPRLPAMMFNLAKRFGRWSWQRIVAIPRFIKDAAKVLWDTIKRWSWQLWQLIVAIPGFIKDVAKAIWDVIKKIPSFCVDVIKACWAALKDISIWLWKLFTQTIPRLLHKTTIFIIEKIVSTGRFILQFVKDVASFFHTLIMAIITFFKAVTLKDVIHALSVVFVSVPKWIWRTIQDIAVAIKDGIHWTLRQMGDLVYCLVVGIWDLLIWLPKKIGQIALGFAEICAAAAREVVWWVSPKSTGCF